MIIAATSPAVALWERYGRIVAARRSSRKDARQTLSMCCRIDNVWSRWTPRYLTDILKGTVSTDVCALTLNQSDTRCGTTFLYGFLKVFSISVWYFPRIVWYCWYTFLYGFLTVSGIVGTHFFSASWECLVLLVHISSWFPEIVWITGINIFLHGLPRTSGIVGINFYGFLKASGIAGIDTFLYGFLRVSGIVSKHFFMTSCECLMFVLTHFFMAPWKCLVLLVLAYFCLAVSEKSQRVSESVDTVHVCGFLGLSSGTDTFSWRLSESHWYHGTDVFLHGSLWMILLVLTHLLMSSWRCLVLWYWHIPAVGSCGRRN